MTDLIPMLRKALHRLAHVIGLWTGVVHIHETPGGEEFHTCLRCDCGRWYCQ